MRTLINICLIPYWMISSFLRGAKEGFYEGFTCGFEEELMKERAKARLKELNNVDR